MDLGIAPGPGAEESAARHDQLDVACLELVPLPVAAVLIGRSGEVLKRLHKKGHLPAITMSGNWLVPRSFLLLVLATAGPGKTGSFEEAARLWFEAQSAWVNRLAGSAGWPDWLPVPAAGPAPKAA